MFNIIMQCIAMMHFGENDNYLAVTSIVLSLLSIGIKSIVMFLNSYCTVMIIHKWTCTLSDFLGMFVTISLAFSRIDGIQGQDYCTWLCQWIQIDGISWLGYFWFYKVLFITLPLIFLLVLGLILFYVHNFWEDNGCLRLSFCSQCFAIFPSLLLFAILWIPGSVAVICGVVAFEVCLYCWSLWIFHQWNHERFPTDYSYSDTWNLIFKFLMHTDENDKKFKSLLMKYNRNNCQYDVNLLKLYSINLVLSDTKSYYQDQRNDELLYQYLQQNESTVFGCHQHKNQKAITMDDFYQNSIKYDKSKPSFFKYFVSEMCSIYSELFDKIRGTFANTEVHFYIGLPAVLVFTFVVALFGPLYALVNRPLTFVYPYIALLWLLYADGSDGAVDFNQSMQTQNITTFQYCIVSVFIIFDFISLYLSIKLYLFERLLTFVLPGHDYINIYSRRKTNVSVYDEVVEYYEFHKYNMLTNEFLVETYGDIGYVIIMYLPQSLGDQQLCKKSISFKEESDRFVL